MEAVYRKIEGKSIQYWGLIVVLVLLALVGLYTFIILYTGGQYITGMNNQIPWGLPIVMAIFLIGASAGSLIISTLSSVFGMKEYKVFSRVAAYLAPLLLIGALMSLGLDLGRPERGAFYLFRYFNFTSMFAINAFLYSTYILISLVYLWAMFNGKEKLVGALGVLAVLWAVVVHSGTGGIFGFIFSRELYHSPLLPPAFIVAALVSGTALIILVLLATFKFTKRPLEDRLIVGMGKLLAAFILVMLLFIIIENFTRAYSPAVREVLRFVLFTYPYSMIFWGVQIFIGIVIPLGILLCPRTSKSIPFIALASVLTTIGVFAERYLIVIPGQVFPQTLFPGKEVSSSANLAGSIVPYSVSLAEVGLVVGVIAVVGLLYAIGLKILDLLPLEGGFSVPAVGVPAGMGAEAGGEDVPEAKVEEEAAARESECELCGAKFDSMDECCEHAEKEHHIAKESCDMACKEV